MVFADEVGEIGHGRAILLRFDGQQQDVAFLHQAAVVVRGGDVEALVEQPTPLGIRV